ncbi:MAG: hypothetical protein U1E60_03670 [Reyranellaceae bacterium]
MRKMVHIDTVSLEALDVVANERKVRPQDLIDEAIADLLKKHHRPITTREMLIASARKVRKG